MPETFDRWAITLSSLAEYVRVVRLSNKDRHELALTLDRIAKEILAYVE